MSRALALVVVPGIAIAGPSEDLASGVGAGSNAVLRMKFEVTFMKIDVAEVEAHLAPSTAAALAPLVEAGGYSGEVADRIGAVLLEADTLMVRMRYLRGSGPDKLHNGMRRMFETSEKAGLIDAAESAEMWATCQASLATLGEEEIAKDSALVYRVDGERVRMVLLDPGREVLWQDQQEGAAWARAVRGGFFSGPSRFRERLVRSLFDVEG